MFELELAVSSGNSSNVYCANKFDWFFDESIIEHENIDACNYNTNLIIMSCSAYSLVTHAITSSIYGQYDKIANVLQPILILQNNLVTKNYCIVLI